MPPQGPEGTVARPPAPAQPARGVPPGVERRRPHQPPEPGAHRLAGQHHVPRHLEVLVHRLAGDEEVHDLARALKDQIDAEVAHDALYRNRLLAPRPRGAPRFVPPAAPSRPLALDSSPPA